jgi:hypothetical protein
VGWCGLPFDLSLSRILLLGLAVLAVFTLGRVKVDYSDGPSWNPCSRLPDGKPALSEDCVSTLGFAAMAVPLLLLLWHIG